MYTQRPSCTINEIDTEKLSIGVQYKEVVTYLLTCVNVHHHFHPL